MRYYELISEKIGGSNLIYHGFNKERYAVQAIKDNQLAGTSTQRFWGDGKRRFDDEPDYEDSYWMKGISATRDIHFAMRWGKVVFVLDRNEIAKNYRIIPFNWSYSIRDSEFHKKEREEFIVTKDTKDTYHFPPEYEGDKHTFDHQRFRSNPEGYVKPLSKFLKGIYLVNENRVTLDGKYPLKGEEKENWDFLKNHPLFLGFYEEPERFDHVKSKQISYGYNTIHKYYALYVDHMILEWGKDTDKLYRSAEIRNNIRERKGLEPYDLTNAKIALMSDNLAKKYRQNKFDKPHFVVGQDGVLHSPEEVMA